MGMTQRAPAVRRAIQALDLLAHRGNASWSDIARGLRLPRSSTSDLVQTMLDERLIRREISGLLLLGGALTEIAAGFVDNSTVLERFSLEWDKGHSLNEHTLSVQSLIGDQNMCVDVRIGRHVLPVTPRAGSRLPVWNGTSGEPILTRLPPSAIEASLHRFGAFCGVNDATRGAILDWVRKNTTGQSRDLRHMVASTGNAELSQVIPGETTDQESVALTLHLPPDTARNVPELKAALSALAARIGEDNG